MWDSSVLEFEEEQLDSVFVSVPDKRRFLDSGELDICDAQARVSVRSKLIAINIHWRTSALDSSYVDEWYQKLLPNKIDG